ncbi:MAG: MFS transporter [Planctomycetota bacterium]|jgi:DHA1 family multidrug resistance protein-like MFS transporter
MTKKIPSADSSEEEQTDFSWKKNYIFVWLSQFFSLMGFSFALPFAPLYIQQLGITDSDEVLRWTGYFAAGAPLSLAVMSPIWGKLADRYGRRLMMLRANFCGTFIIFLMGVVSSPESLIILRVMQGIFTGTISAAITMVSVSTPKHRHGSAVSILTAAIFGGQLAGSALGGYVADIYGCAAAFKIAGGIVGLSFLFVLFGVKEKFSRPEQESRKSQRRFIKLPDVGYAVPLFVLLITVSFALSFERAILPLYIQLLRGNVIEGTASAVGTLFAAAAVAFIIAGLLNGYIIDKTSPKAVIRAAAVISAILIACHAVVPEYKYLLGVRPALFLFAGTISPAVQIWLMNSTPEDKRGEIVGWSASARSIGWVAAPLISTNIAAFTGLHVIYYITGALMLVIIPVMYWADKRLKASTNV